MTRYRNAALFLVLAAVWGSAFMAIKAGLAYFPPVLFAAIRYDVAGLLMLGYAAYAVDDWLPRGRQWLIVAPGAALMIAAYHALLFVGEQGTTSAAAAVIVSLSPVLTAGFARGFLPEERLTPLGAVGLLLGLVGVANLSGLLDLTVLGRLLTGTPIDRVLAALTPAAAVGDELLPPLLVFCAAATFALGSVLTRWVDAELSTESMEAWSMIGGALLMHVASVLLPGESFGAIRWTAEALGALAYLSLAASAVGFLIYFYLLDELGPTEINMVSYVTPVFAAVAGWAWLDEVVDDATVVGFVVIVVGFVLLKRRVLAEEVAAAGIGRRAPTVEGEDVDDPGR